MKRKIQLLKISLKNFKGITDKEIIVDDVTSIYGDNGTGKTTIFDAFTWLLFGKDSTDRKDFEVKTLDKFNKVIPKIDHEVSALIDDNGEQISIRRVLVEKWVKQKGALEPTFTGNETLYYWNDVPMLAKQFADKIAGIMDESVFKMITNPMAFNSLKWQDRRTVLMQIVGSKSDSELAEGNTEFEALISALGTKSFDEYKREISTKRVKLNNDLKEIPVRIAEATNAKPEEKDFVAVRTQIAKADAALKEVELQLSDKTAQLTSFHEAQGKIRTSIFAKQNEVSAIENDAKKEAVSRTTVDTSALDNMRRDLDNKDADLTTAKAGVERLKSDKEVLEKETAQLREDWTNENAKTLTFNDEDFCCPTCKRAFEAGDAEAKKAELIANFKTKKQGILTRINEVGAAKAQSIKALTERIAKGEEHIIALTKGIETIEANIASHNEQNTQAVDGPSVEEIIESLLKDNAEYQTLKSDITALQLELKDTPEIDDAELKARKSELTLQLQSLNNGLSVEAQAAKVKERITELENQERGLSQQIADLEKIEHTVKCFDKHKMTSLENDVNKMFKFVQFKMFSALINGGEEPCCEALINGVPFSNVNTAGKVTGGIDIINTLSDYYGVTAPIFLDNRESVVDLIPTEAQIINLIVEEGSLLSVGKPIYTKEHMAKLAAIETLQSA